MTAAKTRRHRRALRHTPGLSHPGPDPAEDPLPARGRASSFMTVRVQPRVTASRNLTQPIDPHLRLQQRIERPGGRREAERHRSAPSRRR